MSRTGGIRAVVLFTLAALVVGATATSSALASSQTVPYASPLPAGTVQQPFQPTGPNPATIPLVMSQCPQYYFCMWADSNYGGYIESYSGNDSSWTYVGAYFNDQASSIWNERNNASWVDADYPAASRDACIGGGGGWYYKNLANWGWQQNQTSANDSISSYWLPDGTYNNCSGYPQFISE